MIIKLLISQFVNTALIYYIISRIVKEDFLSTTGLVVEVSSLIVVSGVIQIGTNAANIPALLRRIKLWWYYGGMEN